MAKIGVLSAMEEEIASLLDSLESPTRTNRGVRQFHEGTLFGAPCVCVYSRMGKVAAASTAAELISGFGVSEIIFTGVAGAVGESVCIGDIVIGTQLIQHDMDARPIFPRYEIPLLSISNLPVNPLHTERLARAAELFLHEEKQTLQPIFREFGIGIPRVLKGAIASGDRFFAEAAAIQELRQRLPDILCVEMEGAAVAQVCHEYGIPFSIVRTISDSGNECAPVDFQRFIDRVARNYSLGIIRRTIASR